MADVARFSGVNSGTLRTWVKGRSGRNDQSIVMAAKPGEHLELSFINLVEAHVLWSLRNVHKVPLHCIRRAVAWLRNETSRQHPFAELDLMTDGRDVFLAFLGYLYSASESGQRVMPDIVEHYLTRIERDPSSQLPVRFYPITRSTVDGSPTEIVIDPAVAFGRPVIAGTRISTTVVCERFKAGESVADLAEDYGVKTVQIDEAIRCEIDHSRAA